MAKKLKSYTLNELKIIAHALNVLSTETYQTRGVQMNMYHIGRFHNKTHYIDHHSTYGCKVYVKYKGWEQNIQKTLNGEVLKVGK